MNSISIGICQLKQGYDYKENLTRAFAMIDAAASMKADIAVLPEMFMSPYEPVSICSSAEHVQDALESLKEISARLGMYIVAGSMPVGGDGKRRYNRAYVFGKDGKIVFRHDKIHRYQIRF